jgi:hypothetical protein
MQEVTANNRWQQPRHKSIRSKAIGEKTTCVVETGEDKEIQRTTRLL